MKRTYYKRTFSSITPVSQNLNNKYDRYKRIKARHIIKGYRFKVSRDVTIITEKFVNATSIKINRYKI